MIRTTNTAIPGNVIYLFGQAAAQNPAAATITDPFSSLNPEQINDPIAFSTRKPSVGSHLPIPHYRPFITQSLFAHGFHESLFGSHQAPNFGSSGVTSIARDEIYKQLNGAFALIRENDFDTAGARFKELRQLCDKLAPGANGHLDGLLTFSTFLEATYGPVDDETFAALDTVRQHAKKRRETPAGKDTLAREMLIRATAHARLGDDDTALFVLSRFKDQEPVKQPGGLRIMGITQYVNMLCNRAVTHKGEHRDEALSTLYQVMTEDLRESIERFSVSESDADRKENSLAQFYLYIADFFLSQHRPKDAVSLACTALNLFPNNPDLRELFAEDDPEDPLTSTSPLRQLIQKVMSSQGRTGLDNIFAGATELVNAASLPNGKTYWKFATLGSLAGALGASLDGVFFGGVSFPEIMLASATLATAAVGTRKLWGGYNAEETKQAYGTGHTDRQFWGKAFKEAAKLTGTYVAFGGALPLLGFLPDAWLASRDGITGQLHSLGSITSVVTSSAVEHTADLVSSLWSHGVSDGVPLWWNDWASVSPFAEAIDNAIRLPFSDDPLGKIFSGANWNNIPNWMRFSDETPLDIARSIGLGMLYSYAGFSGLYMLSTLGPKKMQKWINEHIKSGAYALSRLGSKEMQKWLHEKIISKVDARHLMPGALAATSALMVASGFGNPAVDPNAALFKAALFTCACYLAQYRHHVQAGNDWNLFKKEARDAVDWGKMMFGGAVQLIYMGPSVAIMPTLIEKGGTMHPKPQIWDWANEVAPYILDNVSAHLGMVGFLALLGIGHALVTGLNVKQTLKAKYAKAGTYEIPGNVGKLMLGLTSLEGNLLAQVFKEFGPGAIVTQSFREAGGSRIQKDALKKTLDRIAKSTGSQGPSEMPSEAFAAEMAEVIAGMRERSDELYRQGAIEIARGFGYEYQKASLHDLQLADQLLVLADSYLLPLDGRALFSPDEHPEWYRTKIYRALVDPSTSAETVDEFLNRLTAIAYDMSSNQYDARRYLLIATMGAAAGAAHGERIKRYFTEGNGKPLVQAYGLEKQNDQMLQMKSTKGLSSATWGIGLSTASSWMRQHLKPRPETNFYNSATTAGRKYSFSAMLTGRSLIEHTAALTSFISAASNGNPAFQTYADPTFFRDTLYWFLMTDPKDVNETPANYEFRVIAPILKAVGEASKKLQDNRKDVRHNLLTTIWLAQLGPNREIIQPWIVENKHLFHANGVSIKPKATIKVKDKKDSRKNKDKPIEFPRSLKQKRQIKALFNEYLRHSNNSADGQVVYPTVPLRTLDWRMH